MRMPTDKKETNTAKGTARTARSMTAAANRSKNPAGSAVLEALPVMYESLAAEFPFAIPGRRLGIFVCADACERE
jgi:hypothetical protein